jgi:hypothetical protein
MKDLIWGSIGLVILFGILVGIISISAGDSSNDCQQGYHWEEDFRGTVGGCVHD